MSNLMRFEEWLKHEIKRDLSFKFQSEKKQRALHAAYVQTNSKVQKEKEQAKRIADKKSAQLEEYKKALTFSTYELAEIVIDVVARNNYNNDKLMEVASILSDQMHIDEILTGASKKLSNAYEIAIKNIAGKRCTNINYSEKAVSVKLESLVDSCIAIGTGAIGKKIGLSASSTGSPSSKGEIRKTKKWKDN